MWLWVCLYNAVSYLILSPVDPSSSSDPLSLLIIFVSPQGIHCCTCQMVCVGKNLKPKQPPHICRNFAVTAHSFPSCMSWLFVCWAPVLSPGGSDSLLHRFFHHSRTKPSSQPTLFCLRLCLLPRLTASFLCVPHSLGLSNLQELRIFYTKSISRSTNCLLRVVHRMFSQKEMICILNYLQLLWGLQLWKLGLSVVPQLWWNPARKWQFLKFYFILCFILFFAVRNRLREIVGASTNWRYWTIWTLIFLKKNFKVFQVLKVGRWREKRIKEISEYITIHSYIIYYIINGI